MSLALEYCVTPFSVSGSGSLLVLAPDPFLTLVPSAMVVALAVESPGLALFPPPALALGVAPFLVRSLALALSPALGSSMTLALKFCVNPVVALSVWAPALLLDFGAGSECVSGSGSPSGSGSAPDSGLLGTC